ncbi:hypothetical protein MPTK1_6g13140 [Marchantia polymorpha subsp. ruderalis]|uniref:Uncharacterized protein n=2 Tax=Marchantia polymorpha TaxID=3197 RepID=A0AAF6BRK1_MARPO|nr:hypothetical protein MARPO_0059s0036 [Marchantia polymorpha]BBN14635.1 hypothetical protein Mp_6g13140 [Marchantia polymorpha subsp. ruderalis]|eukprot:PTQ37089.1 hypothetical protein MARPO_0059s0036 [Marchantia polymorpha]
MEAKREYMCKERIVDLEFKISRLGILGKAYYDLVQIKLNRHRNQIMLARTQNMLLHAALDTLRHKALIARKNLGDLDNLRKTVASLRVTYDHQRKLVFSRQRKLEAQVTDTHSAELECAGVLDPNTPDLIRIRRLESMLSAVRLKTKDVQILMKHYEATLSPMKEEYYSYGAKLEACQNVLNIKKVECERLIHSHHDAIRARDASKKELEELIGRLFGRDGRDMVSPEMEANILAAIKEIKKVMEVRSMREMYHQLLLQEKQSAYLQSIYVELKRTVDQLKNDYPPRRKSSIQPHAVQHMIEGTKLIVRRQSSRKGSLPLLQILEGTQKLVERLHEGNLTIPSGEGATKEVLTLCQERISNLVQALHRKMKFMQREAHKKAKEEAKAAGTEYEREARFAEFDKEDDARKEAKEKHKEAIRREIAARAAAAQIKEEEREAAKEVRRAQIRVELEQAREKSRKEAEEQAEKFRQWQKQNEPARSSIKKTISSSAQAPKSVTIEESITHSVESLITGPTFEGMDNVREDPNITQGDGKSAASTVEEEAEAPVMGSTSYDIDKTQYPAPATTDESPSQHAAHSRVEAEVSAEAASSSQDESTSQHAAHSGVEAEVSAVAASSSQDESTSKHAAHSRVEAEVSAVAASSSQDESTSQHAAHSEVQAEVSAVAASSSQEHATTMDSAVTHHVSVPTAPVSAQEETNEPEVQPIVAASSQEHEGVDETAPAE